MRTTPQAAKLQCRRLQQREESTPRKRRRKRTRAQKQVEAHKRPLARGSPRECNNKPQRKAFRTEKPTAEGERARQTAFSCPAACALVGQLFRDTVSTIAAPLTVT